MYDMQYTIPRHLQLVYPMRVAVESVEQEKNHHSLLMA